MADVLRQLPDMVRQKAEALGHVGRSLLAGLDGVIGDLCAAWDLTMGNVMTGGSAAFVAEARTTDGQDAVLKIAIPGLGTVASGLRTLLAADGQGYARVLRHDLSRAALLLERLGPHLGTLGLSVDAQVDAMCATLQEAWRAPPEGGGFMDGAEKARSLAEFIEATWRELGQPCSARVIDTAVEFARERGRAFDPAAAVLAHGDAHPWNALLVPGSEPPRFKLVDPDGLFIERAYDLGVLMREWGTELLAGDPLALGRQRCERLAELTGVAPGPIWAWGFVERTSSGLFLAQLGLDDMAREFLAVAEVWAAARHGTSSTIAS